MKFGTCAVWFAIVLGASACCVQQEHTGRVVQPQAWRLGFSGMVAISSGKYLVVHDTKGNSTDPRVSVLAVAPSEPPRWLPVEVDWRGQQPASDLESVCAIPGSPDEFLLCESNYWKGKYGRVLRVRLQSSGNGFSMTVLDSAQLPHFEDDIEGLTCLKASAGSLLLVLGQRGGKHGSAGQFHCAWLDLAKHEVQVFTSQTIHAPAFHWADASKKRDCADLYLDGRNQLWSVATEDSGDAGPFRSVVYLVATVQPDSRNPLSIVDNPRPAWICEGIKVEALAAPLPGSTGLTVGSDDENYPGIFRPLFALPK